MCEVVFYVSGKVTANNIMAGCNWVGVNEEIQFNAPQWAFQTGKE